MTTIYLETSDDATQVRSLVDAAIKREIAHLELALTLAKQRLIPFEEKLRSEGSTGFQPVRKSHRLEAGATKRSS